MQLKLVNLRLDGGTQPRAEILIEVVDDYAEQMQAGVVFPPVTVYFDGREYWLTDGFHRVYAALKLDPDGSIEAEVLQGTQSDSQWHSYGVNKSHGLRRTNDDKRRIVQAALRHPNAAQLSSTAIAAHCGVDEKTVRHYREKACASSEIPKMRRVTRGKSSYVQDASRIGRRTGKRQTSASAAPVSPPRRKSNPMEKTTALNVPHNPVAAARALIAVFDTEFLSTLMAELSRYLQDPLSPSDTP